MNDVLARWNSLDPDSAAREILPCCGSQAWAEALTAKRPYTNEAALFTASDTIWLSLPEAAWQQAFDSHPRIGQKHAQTHTTAESLRWSAQEQRTALSTDASAKLALEDANRRYEQRFNRIFIVCAAALYGGLNAALQIAVAGVWRLVTMVSPSFRLGESCR